MVAFISATHKCNNKEYNNVKLQYHSITCNLNTVATAYNIGDLCFGTYVCETTVVEQTKCRNICRSDMHLDKLLSVINKITITDIIILIVEKNNFKNIKKILIFLLSNIKSLLATYCNKDCKLY